MGVDPAVLAEAVQRIGVLLSVTDPRLHPDVKVIIDGLTQAQADLAAARRERDMAVHVVQAEGKADYLLPVYEMNAFRVTVSRAEAERDAAVQALANSRAEHDAARLALGAAEDRERGLREALDWVGRFAEAHHASQAEHYWLHALTVDIPEHVKSALGSAAVPPAAGRAEALAGEVERLRDAIDCACNALTDSICASGNDAKTNLKWVKKLRAHLVAPRPARGAGEKKETPHG